MRGSDDDAVLDNDAVLDRLPPVDLVSVATASLKSGERATTDYRELLVAAASTRADVSEP